MTTPLPKRVLFIFPAPSLAAGGAQRVFSTLLRHLDRERFDLHLALLQMKRGEGDDIPDDVVVHDLKNARVRYALPAAVRLIRRLKPDTVVSTLGHLNVALLLSKPLFPRKTRLLIRESTTPSVFLDHGTSSPAVWRYLYRRFYRKADKVICLSDSMAEDLKKAFGVPAEKIARIYNPVDIAMVQKMAETGGNPFAGPGPNLVAAGRFYAEKGYDLLLEAMPQVLNSCPQARLFILGEGPLESQLRAHANQLGLSQTVIFAGMQSNPWRYFRHADVVVFPSRYEGLPNVPLEALALGTPVVATDCPGAIREIQCCDDRLVIVPPESPAALAEAIIDLCRKNFSRRPPTQLFLQRFDLQQAVDEYSRLL